MKVTPGLIGCFYYPKTRASIGLLKKKCFNYGGEILQCSVCSPVVFTTQYSLTISVKCCIFSGGGVLLTSSTFYPWWS